MKLENISLGIYEKALPKNISWRERLQYAKELGFSFVEMSVDETDERLARVDWTKEERKEIVNAILDTGVRINSICFSGHRRYPLGSEDVETREKSLELMRKVIDLALDLGVRNIQLAGYDVYYQESNERTRELYIQGMKKVVKWAEKANMLLSIEIMDHPFMNSITKFLEISKEFKSPFLAVYPDVGNLSAWGNDVEAEFKKGIDSIVAIHLKDTLAVTPTFKGKFKEVEFGTGCVDFVKIFKLLKELNYTGPFMIEMWTEKAENPLKEIENARKWIIEKMEDGGYLC